MTAIYYASFALNSALANEPAQLGEFMRVLHRITDQPDAVLLMSDEAVVASPNFRRAYRGDEHRPFLKEVIRAKKIVVASMEGLPTGANPEDMDYFTFTNFQPWFDRFKLWKEDPWGHHPENYKILDDRTQGELRLFDRFISRLPIPTRHRDRTYAQNFLTELDCPVLHEGLGEHHAAFKDIARKVYIDPDTGLIIPEGIIRVIPYALAKEGQNIHSSFACYLNQQMVPDERAFAMLGLVRDFGLATLEKITGELIEPVLHREYGNQATLTLVPAHDQTRWLRIIGVPEISNPFAVRPPAPGPVAPERSPFVA